MATGEDCPVLDDRDALLVGTDGAPETDAMVFGTRGEMAGPNGGRVTPSPAASDSDACAGAGAGGESASE